MAWVTLLAAECVLQIWDL